jgi:hypothetical protein
MSALVIGFRIFVVFYRRQLGSPVDVLKIAIGIDPENVRHMLCLQNPHGVIGFGMCQGLATTPVKRLRKIRLSGWIDPDRIRCSLHHRLPTHKTLRKPSVGSG